ncbi:MAG TPA: hypothetical protein VG815_22445 [Chloroflexota bacterium]|nr:hypothetical protein [Chloroflexota bacterium]
MVVREISLIANDLDQLIDDYEIPGIRKKEKDRLLEKGLVLSLRGLELLRQEPLMSNPSRYLEQIRAEMDINPYQVARDLRQDSTTLTFFLEAETRLLMDLGLTEDTASQIRSALEEVLQDDKLEPRDVSRRIGQLMTDLRAELGRVHNNRRHDRILDRLMGVLETLGGGILIAANAAFVGPGTVLTGPLSPAGAAVSIAGGTEVIGRGVDRARGG